MKPASRGAPPAAFVAAPSLFLALGLTACPLSVPPDFSSAPDLGPVAVGDRLAVADPDDDSLIVLDLDRGKHVGTRRIPLGGRPSLVRELPDTPVALVLSREDRTLDIVSTDDGQRETVFIGAPFEGLAISPDGDLAIAYYPPGTANAVFHNENEIAVIPLPATETAPVTRRTLASLGGAPIAVEMSPRVGTRRFAFVLSDEHVAIVALDDLEMPERSVPLVSLTTGGRRTPTGVVFAADQSTTTLWAIVSTLEASSVYALAIEPSAPSEAEEPNFGVRLTQLAGISPGGAATLVALGDALYTLTSSPAAGTLTLTDVSTATGETLAIQSGLDRIHVFDGEDGRPMALTWASTNGFTFHVVDLEKMEAGANKAFETRTVRDAFSTLLPIPQTTSFVALHLSDDEGMSVINAATSRVTGFGRTGRVGSLELVPALNRLFVLTHFASDDFIVSVDLETLHPDVAEVPDGASDFAVLPNVGTLAAIAHPEGGRVTLWPTDATADDTTRVVSGFLLEGLFQR